jgi:hypothetical protein
LASTPQQFDSAVPASKNTEERFDVCVVAIVPVTVEVGAVAGGRMFVSYVKE